MGELPNALIVGDGVSDGAIRKATALCGLQKNAPVFAEGDNRAPAGGLGLIARPNDDALARMFAHSVCGCLETGALDRLGADLAAQLARNDLIVALCTRTTFPIKISHYLIGMVARSLGRGSETLADLELAVHEAYSNGLIHGNLEISSHLRGSMEDYRRYSEKIEQRLNDPDYGDRAIVIGVRVRPGEQEAVISIEDEGPGYTEHMSIDDDARKHGRGLGIIRDLVSEVKTFDRGSRVELTCRWPVEGDVTQ